MKIEIKVIPNAKKKEVIKEGDKIKIKVNSPAIEGKANKEVIEDLAKFLNVKKSRISIIKGERSRNKLIEII